MKPIALDIASARQALSLGRTKIYDLLKSGALVRVKIGRKTLITVASIEALVDTCTVGGDR